MPSSVDVARIPAQGTCLVTGGAGFVGASTVRALLAAGRQVLVVDDLSAGRLERLPAAHPGLSFVQADVRAPGLLAGLLQGHGVRVLLHFAGPVGVRRVLADPQAAEASIRSQGEAIVRELAALPSRARPRLLAASTSEVYAEQAGAMAEGSPLRQPGGAARWCYALAKRACELRFDACGLWPLERGPLHLRLFNVVGPGQDGDSGMVLPTFVARAAAGQALPVHGDGAQERTYGHVDDVGADIATLVGLDRVPAGPLNLGGTATASAAELARLVVRTVAGEGGPRSRLEFVDPASQLEGFAEVRRRVPDLTRARALGLAQKPRRLEAIVADTLASYAQRGTLSCASPAS